MISPQKRFKTRSLLIGNVLLGGDNPIRIQSMTTSNTRDVEATIEQIICLANMGAEMARVTVQGMKEAESCELIKNGLMQKGYTIPLIADIHFYPPAALRVIESVDKVRINPGNFADKRAVFKKTAYTDASYQEEIDRIEEVFSPLVEKSKALGKTLRIGANHGSLSDRIMNRYGDTPFGMVESAFEYARICRKYDFHNIVFSMKSSNPIVMIAAYRLLASEMEKLSWDYPIHLGVTEAGEGEDGRVKSYVGIGTLLQDGIGDTIRVSLTEDPWCEIDPCKRLRSLHAKAMQFPLRSTPKRYERSKWLQKEGKRFLNPDGTVLLAATTQDIEDPEFFAHIGCDVQFGQPICKKGTVDALIVDRKSVSNEKLSLLRDRGVAIITDPYIINGDDPISWDKLLDNTPSFALFKAKDDRVEKGRAFFAWQSTKALSIPIFFQFTYTGSQEDFTLDASIECGSLLIDGLGHGVCIKAPFGLGAIREFSFTLLQSVRMRSSKTEFISCPGCGRTLFDLQVVSKLIREKTGHLPGVKIAVMGCIVNGPGEMADADFGYVGSKAGKIDLYVGKQCVKRDISMDLAVNELISLIQEHGKWVEPTNLLQETSRS